MHHALRTLLSVLPLSFAATIVEAAPRQTESPAGLRWTNANQPLAHYASVGNHGALAWIAQTKKLQLIATTDDATPAPAPIWEVSFPYAYNVFVRAADKSPAAVVLEQVYSPLSHYLHYFTAFSSTPLFTIQMPSGFDPCISEDGNIVSATFTNSAGRAEVRIYDVRSATPTIPIRTFSRTGPYTNAALSADGSTALLLTASSKHVYDVNLGQVVFSASRVVNSGPTLSRDGRAFGIVGTKIRAFVHDGTTYSLVLDVGDPSLGTMSATQSAFSADGSTFVAAATDSKNWNEFRVYVWSVQSGVATKLWTYAHTGSGNYQDVPSAVSVSDDGRWIAVGSWGARYSGHPEALLFDRDAGNVPVAFLDTPGSVMQLDLSGNGWFLVAGTKSVHANASGGTGEAYSFDRGGRTHRLVGTPSIGRRIQLETYGVPGDRVLQALATNLLPTGVPVPTLSGLLELDTTTLFGGLVRATIGASGPMGPVVRTIDLPFDPALVGTTSFAQSLRWGTNAFDETIPLSITP